MIIAPEQAAACRRKPSGSRLTVSSVTHAPYPQGDQYPLCTLGNFVAIYTNTPCVVDTSMVGTCPSGASQYSALDMAGNVFEWINDCYQENFYRVSPYSNPPGPTSGYKKVQRQRTW
jgi:formylglycine-generating enzyme required for sulfatase activity